MNNIERIRQELSKCECDAMLVTSPVNRLFATGFSSSAGMLLVSADDAWFFTDTRYIEAATAKVSKASVTIATDDETYAKQLNRIFEKHGIKTVGFEDGETTYSEYLDLEKKLSAALCPMQKLMNSLRAVKSLDDFEGMKKAQRILEKTFVEILPLISTQITEKDLATEIIYRMLKNGADDKSFDPIVVSNAKSSMPHGVPENRKIEKGFLTIDFGARLNGWCSDMTRTVSVGKPDDEMIKVYETVLQAQEAGIAYARAGVKGRDIDAAARAVINDAGYGEYFGHGFGHGIGLQVHETPRASQISEEMMPVGAMISAEPGIYLPGRFGVRIEDVLYLTENGNINITTTEKDLIVID